MVEVVPLSLVVTQTPGPCVLVLCPIDEYEQHDTCRIVPIWVGAADAAALGLAIEGKRLQRPMTHDLFLDALTNLDAHVDRVVITRVEGKIFHSNVVLRAGDRTITLDARPSDSVSLAIRQGSPIYMEDDVLNKASYPFVFKREKDNADELAEFHAFVESLDPDDFLE